MQNFKNHLFMTLECFSPHSHPQHYVRTREKMANGGVWSDYTDDTILNSIY